LFSRQQKKTGIGFSCQQSEKNFKSGIPRIPKIKPSSLIQGAWFYFGVQKTQEFHDQYWKCINIQEAFRFFSYAIARCVFPLLIIKNKKYAI
jgi:hypothetical protein